MKNKKFKFLSFCLVLGMFLGLTGCKSSKKNYDNYATVIYNLEGGIYRGSSEAVKVYYNVSEGSTQTVGTTLENLDTNQINPYGDNVFSGWYYKDENGNKVDFTSNYKIGYKEQLNVYANWRKKITFTWEFKANVEGEDIVLASYDFAQPGDALSVDSNRLKTLKEALLENNYTYDGSNESGSFVYNGTSYTIDNLSNIVMPDDEVNHTETIYVNCISGRYKYVSTLTELSSALKSDFVYNDDDINNIIYYEGIYLANDIESTSYINFAQLTGNSNHTIKFIGNNHKITYSFASRSGVSEKINNTNYNCGTIFNQASYLDIENLEFDITFNANVSNTAIIGFAMGVNNCNINNVKVKFDYKIGSKNALDTLFVPSVENYSGIYDTDNSKNNTITNFDCTITNITEGE